MPDIQDALYFLVETYENGEWKWNVSYNSLTDAIHKFRDLLLENENNVVRITSPTNTSIYNRG